MTGRYSKERGKGKGKVNGVWLIAASLTTMGTHMAYGITQCYLPPGTDDIPTLTQPKLVLDLATPEGCKAELT